MIWDELYLLGTETPSSWPGIFFYKYFHEPSLVCLFSSCRKKKYCGNGIHDGIICKSLLLVNVYFISFSFHWIQLNLFLYVITHLRFLKIPIWSRFLKRTLSILESLIPTSCKSIGIRKTHRDYSGIVPIPNLRGTHIHRTKFVQVSLLICALWSATSMFACFAIRYYRIYRRGKIYDKSVWKTQIRLINFFRVSYR